MYNGVVRAFAYIVRGNCSPHLRYKKKKNNTRISDKEVQKEKNIGHIEPDAPHTPSTTIIFMLYTKEMAFETTKSAGL